MKPSGSPVAGVPRPKCLAASSLLSEPSSLLSEPPIIISETSTAPESSAPVVAHSVAVAALISALDLGFLSSESVPRSAESTTFALLNSISRSLTSTFPSLPFSWSRKWAPLSKVLPAFRN